MNIKYKDDKQKKLFENKDDFIEKYKDKHLYKAYVHFKNKVMSSNNIGILIRTYKSLQVRKVAGKEDVWYARLNEKWRVHFLLVNNEVSIQIIKIDPHSKRY